MRSSIWISLLCILLSSSAFPLPYNQRRMLNPPVESAAGSPEALASVGTNRAASPPASSKPAVEEPKAGKPGSRPPAGSPSRSSKSEETDANADRANADTVGPQGFTDPPSSPGFFQGLFQSWQRGKARAAAMVQELATTQVARINQEWKADRDARIKEQEERIITQNAEDNEFIANQQKALETFKKGKVTNGQVKQFVKTQRADKQTYIKVRQAAQKGFDEAQAKAQRDSDAKRRQDVALWESWATSHGTGPINAALSPDHEAASSSRQ